MGCCGSDFDNDPITNEEKIKSLKNGVKGVDLEFIEWCEQKIKESIGSDR